MIIFTLTLALVFAYAIITAQVTLKPIRIDRASPQRERRKHPID